MNGSFVDFVNSLSPLWRAFFLSLENPQLGWGVQKSLKLCVIVLNKKTPLNLIEQVCGLSNATS